MGDGLLLRWPNVKDHEGGEPFANMVGSSQALQRIFAHVSRVAPTDCTVLVTGESGTGKELIARAIHDRSNRCGRAFVRVNCAAIPPALIASELFGHERGAFTDATQRRLGRFEIADGGTLFLDEIGEVPFETQIALLRVLQEREFERIGGSHPVAVDVRLIAATNRDLKHAVETGGFRLDLFYRLNVFPIHMPALRDRKEDLSALVAHFVQRFAGKVGKKISYVSKPTLKMLEEYDWPGNIRELQNVIERAVILSDGNSLAVDRSWLRNEADGARDSYTSVLFNQERGLIEKALEMSCGRVSGPSGAAAKLDIPRQTLESRIKALKINKYRYRARGFS